MAEKRRTLTVTLKLDGAREALKALNGFPKEVSDQVRDSSQTISEWLAADVAAAGRADSPQSAAVAGTTRANRDRVPNITVGGAKRVTSRRVPSYLILFGANFGATTYRVPGRVPFFVHPHAGKGKDYWIFKTAEASNPRINQEWSAAVDAAIAWFGRSG